MLLGRVHARIGTLPIGPVVILDPIYYDALRIMMARVFSRFCGYHADSRSAAVGNQASCSASAGFGVVNKRMSSSLTCSEGASESSLSAEFIPRA